MHNNFRALILDLDGTVVTPSPDGMPTGEVVSAVRKAKDKGIRISVATGRPHNLAKKPINALGITELCVYNGGAVIADPLTGENILTRTITVEAQQQVVAIANRFDKKITINRDDIVLNTVSVNDITVPADKVLVRALTPRETVALVEEFEAIEGIAIHPTASWDGRDLNDLHVTSHEATKKHATEELLRLMVIDKADTMAIGDNHNDLPLFEAVGFKVAMGHAPQQIKDAADHITESFENDGVAVAIKKFLL